MIDWEDIDWDQPTSVIAEITGKYSQYVTKYRAKYAPETRGKHYIRSAYAKEKWKRIDWRKSTSQINRETGFPRRTIEKARLRWAPSSIRPNVHQVALETYRDVDWSLSDSEIASQLGRNRSVVYKMRRKLGHWPRNKQFPPAGH